MYFTEKQIKELKLALKDKSLSYYHKRIQAVYLCSQHMTYKSISDLVNLSHNTIWRLVKRYEQLGLPALIQDTRGGRHRSYLTEEELAFLKEQFVCSSPGQFVTITEMHAAYQNKIGKQTTREGFYALLKRHGWRKVTPRPEHPQKADAETILASKHKILTQDKEKALQIQSSLSQSQMNVAR